MKKMIPLIVCLFAGLAHADAYVDANAAAIRGDHRAAVTAFEHDIADHGWSANALLGLSNAYASTGDLGHAILALERAQILAPHDAAITHNLAGLRERAAIDAPTTTRTDQVVHALSADAWTWLALGGLGLGCAGVLAIAWTSRRRTGAWTAALGLLLAAGAGALALQAAPDPDLAVVVRAEPARIAPFAAADAAFAARPGEHVHIEQRREQFLYVRADGDPERAGWMPRDAVETVIPADRAAPHT
jgi:hypothetical protein